MISTERYIGSVPNYVQVKLQENLIKHTLHSHNIGQWSKELLN